MKRLVPFIVICVSVVVFAAVGPHIGEDEEHVSMFSGVAPVTVDRLN